SPNGVYKYGAASAFPDQTFNASNYWVDVVFADTVAPDTTPPTVTAVNPANGSTGNNPSGAVTAVFSENMLASSIGTTSFELRDGGNNPGAATVSSNSATRAATLQPSSPLSVSTTYTARVIGGATDPRVKDLAGNALAATFTWTFITS